METQYSNSLPVIEIQRKKITLVKSVLRAVSIILGILGLILAAFMVLSIILILPGFGLGIISILFILGGALQNHDAHCPNCNKKNAVLKNKEDFKCKRCSQPVIIKWIEPK